MGGFFSSLCKRLPGRVLGPFHIYVRLLGMSRDQGTVQPHAASADPARRRFRLNGLWPSRNSEFSHEKWVDLSSSLCNKLPEEKYQFLLF